MSPLGVLGFLVVVATPSPTGTISSRSQEFRARYEEEAMARSLNFYFEGAFADAPVPLQKLLENTSKAAVHEEASALLLDITNAISFFKTAQTELSNDRPEQAEPWLRKALALDETLVLGPALARLPDAQKRRELERRTSFVRQASIEGMSNTCYRLGRTHADAKELGSACKVWKLGLSYSRANADLLKAGYFCTQRARDALARATDCKQLEAVLDLSVDGDGFKEQVLERLAQNCK